MSEDMKKIENKNKIETHYHHTMRFIGYINIEKQCGIIEFNPDKKYLVDFEDFNRIIFFDKKFTFDTEKDKYPSYNYNYKRISLFEYLYKVNIELIDSEFLNDNEYDLRKENVKIYHYFQKLIDKKYNILEYIEGHYNTSGCEAYKIKNPLWKVLNTETNKENILMLCTNDDVCILCPKSYEKIQEFEKNTNDGKKLTFYKHSNGYVLCSYNSLYIHQIIMDFHGNGQGTKNESVDHIDQNPLNNSFENLRIATRLEQEQNSKGIKEGTKRERKHNAKSLPDGITQDMMRKYVVYYEECYNKEKDLHREFFKVERHPRLDKHWMSSKSGKITILEKLGQANKIVDDLENNIQPEQKKTLPTHITISNFREKPHLIFDKRCDDGKRQNLKMVLTTNYILDAELERFAEKIWTKYEIKI
jgi:hypothetical protein